MKSNPHDYFRTAPVAANAAPDSQTAFHFDPKSRRYSIEGPVGLKNARLGIEVDGSMHWADEAAHATWSDGEANFEFAEPHLGWKVRFKWLSECPALLISSTLENRGKQPVKLGRCRLADTDSATSEVRFGPHPANAAALLTKGAGNPPWWSKSLMQSPEPLVSKTLTQWFSPGSGPALQFGFVTFDRAETVIESKWDKARQVPVVSAWNDFNGFELGPGASVDSEELAHRPGIRPFGRHGRLGRRRLRTLPSSHLAQASRGMGGMGMG